MARQAGYLITLRLFLPVDQKDIGDTIAKARAVQAAEAGNLASIAEAETIEFRQVFTSRNTGTGRAGAEDAEEKAFSQAERGIRRAKAPAQRMIYVAH